MRSGLFAQENLEIQWIVVNSNVVVTALMAGEIDVAGIAGSSMRAAARGAPLKANFFPYYKIAVRSYSARPTSSASKI